MDITKQMQSLIDSLKADKTMAQPYKNYAISDALRLQAVIERGVGTTNQKPPDGINLDKPPERMAEGGCTCDPNQKPFVNCPVHGIN
jgi:hypothetical protein